MILIQHSLVSIQTPAFLSYCLPIQGRKARASTSVYEFDGVVIGQHIYKHVWSSLTDKSISASMEEDKEHE